MPGSKIQKVIAKFLASDKAEVICVRGAWGTGKTYAWKHWLDQEMIGGRVPWQHYSYCSLFGMNALSDLKAGLYENTVGLIRGKPVSRASLTEVQGLWNEGKKLLRKGSWLAANAATLIPASGKLGDASARLLFLMVRDQLICIDDVERRGANLSIGDVLGMISFLKEQRGCKVVLILNDEKLEPEDKQAFDRYLEKVADVSVAFSPSVADCAAIGLGPKSDLNDQITKHLEVLQISNIRVIQRIRRLVDEIEPILWKRDPRLLPDAAKTLCALGWIEFMPDVAPPWAFAQQRFLDRAFSRMARDEPPEHKVWNGLLDQLDLGELSEFDMALQSGVKQGYFDEEVLDGWIDLMETHLANGDADIKLRAAWELYRGNMTATEDEIVATFIAAVRGVAKRIPNSELNVVVVVLRQIGRESEANDLIRYVIENRSDDRGFFYRRQEVTDGTLIDLLIANAPIRIDERPLSKVLVEGLYNFGGVSIQRLKEASVGDLKDALLNLESDVLQVLDALHRVEEKATNGSTVAENAREAVRQITSESGLRAAQMGRFVVDPPSFDKAFD